MVVICESCGKEINKKPSQIMPHIFCSRKCYGIFAGKKYEKERLFLICANCGCTFSRNKVAIKEGLNFCTSLCWKEYLKKNNSVETICSYCGIKFEIFKSKLLENTNRFCSGECKHKWHSEFLKNENNPSYKGNNILICEYCNKEFLFKDKYVCKPHKKNVKYFCSEVCKNIWKKNNLKRNRKKVPPVCCIDCGKILKRYTAKRCVKCAGKNYSLRFNKRKGIQYVCDLVRRTKNYKLWRKLVYQRDNFICQNCGADKKLNNNIILHAHHIVPFNYFISFYDYKIIEDYNNCEDLWDINNGITLCLYCHRNEHSKKGSNIWR